MLFLAVPQDTFQTLLKQPVINDLLVESGLKILVYNSTNEVIEEWVK